MAEPLRFQFGELVLDLERYRVLLADEPIVLTYREYALLVYLVTRAGHVVSKRRLLEEGMGRHDVGGLRMVDEHIRHLKSKLEREGRVRIEEVEGAGYRFIGQGGAP
jgi:two-component system alkaline phosphatase synthesis response regulator PhoP